MWDDVKDGIVPLLGFFALITGLVLGVSLPFILIIGAFFAGIKWVF